MGKLSSQKFQILKYSLLHKQFLPSLQQDCLADNMKPPRVKTGNHVLSNITECAAWNFVAIDPCIS